MARGYNVISCSVIAQMENFSSREVFFFFWHMVSRNFWQFHIYFQNDQIGIDNCFTDVTLKQSLGKCCTEPNGLSERDYLHECEENTQHETTCVFFLLLFLLDSVITCLHTLVWTILSECIVYKVTLRWLSRLSEREESLVFFNQINIGYILWNKRSNKKIPHADTHFRNNLFAFIWA